MNIALIGASGHVGTRILKELVDRGHAVTAIARHPDAIVRSAGVTRVRGDVSDPPGLVAVLRGHDVVISSVRFLDADAQTLIGVVKAAGARRYLVVGGAGSLELAPGKRLLDSPDFPAEYRPEAEAGARFLDALRDEHTLDWVFISPSALFAPGRRTGHFRLGTDTLLSNDQGSSISFEDFAVALVDEIEKPAHHRQRFTVGY